MRGTEEKKMNEKLNEMEQKLKSFILSNKDFKILAKKFTFIFRDFTPYIDYCKIRWNREEKDWEFVEYYLHNKNKKLPANKIDIFFLELNIDGLNWGTFLGELGLQFDQYLKKEFPMEEFDKDSTKYKQLKKKFFEQHKEDIKDSFFRLNEETIMIYFMKTLKRLRHLRFDQVNRLMH